MNLDRAVMAFAGVMILASVLLVHFVSPWWLLFTAFIGLNMLQASLTGFCPAAMANSGASSKGTAISGYSWSWSGRLVQPPSPYPAPHHGRRIRSGTCRSS